MCLDLVVFSNDQKTVSQVAVYISQLIMKQLKGKVKETHKEKRQRREDFSKQKERLFTIVLPTLLAISAIIAAYVYFNTRPKNPLV